MPFILSCDDKIIRNCHKNAVACCPGFHFEILSSCLNIVTLALCRKRAASPRWIFAKVMEIISKSKVKVNEIPTHLLRSFAVLFGLSDLHQKWKKKEEAPFSRLIQFHHIGNGALRGTRLEPSLIRDPQIYEKNKHLNTKVEQRALEGYQVRAIINQRPEILH